MGWEGEGEAKSAGGEYEERDIIREFEHGGEQGRLMHGRAATRSALEEQGAARVSHSV
jgi:hypothetical protein